jgi:hypothetical protein
MENDLINMDELVIPLDELMSEAITLVELKARVNRGSRSLIVGD